MSLYGQIARSYLKNPSTTGKRSTGLDRLKLENPESYNMIISQSLFAYMQRVLLSEVLLCPTFVEIFDFSRSGLHINTSYKPLVNIPYKERSCYPIIGKNQQISYEACTIYHIVCGVTK